MKRKYIALLGFAMLTAGVSSCVTMMDEARDAKQVEYIKVFCKANAVTGFVDASGQGGIDASFPTEGLKVVFNNYNEGNVIESITDKEGYASAMLTPGVYTISVSGVQMKDNQKYYLNGSAQNISMSKNISKAEAADLASINLRPAGVGPLCIKEIYYCGTANDKANWFRDQSYEIYNNGDEICYLDFLCFAQLYPNYATDETPSWPVEEGRDNFVYGLVMWQLPGTGKDYPLAPGESIVIAQEASNHTVNFPTSIDNSKAEWEAWNGKKPERDNPKVPNLRACFYGGFRSYQWLTSVAGAAFCLYQPGKRLPEFNAKDPVEGAEAKAYWVLGKTTQKETVGSGDIYAKIPADKVMDGVELLPDMNSLNMKRIPGFVDAGGTSVGQIYCGKTVARRVTGKRTDGTPLYKDTNNSTDDFEIMDHPKLRRNAEKVPSWSPNK